MSLRSWATLLSGTPPSLAFLDSLTFINQTPSKGFSCILGLLQSQSEASFEQKPARIGMWLTYLQIAQSGANHASLCRYVGDPEHVQGPKTHGYIKSVAIATKIPGIPFPVRCRAARLKPSRLEEPCAPTKCSFWCLLPSCPIGLHPKRVNNQFMEPFQLLLVLTWAHKMSSDC